jgi:uncharacterized membrane protein
VKRGINILGRGGTTLIAISLALLLVSLIPQVRTFQAKGTEFLSPGEDRLVFNQLNITPHQEVQLTVTVEGKVTVYLLEKSLEYRIFNGTIDYWFNVTDLQENPDQIIWEDEVENGEYTRSYNPSRVMNATIIVYNQPDSEEAYLQYDLELRNALAPKEKAQNIAYLAVPIGVIMATPWILIGWKQRKRNSANRLGT